MPSRQHGHGHRYADDVRHDVARVVRNGSRQIWLSDAVFDSDAASKDQRHLVGYLAGIREGVIASGTALVVLSEECIAMNNQDDADVLYKFGTELEGWRSVFIPKRGNGLPRRAFEIRIKIWADDLATEATDLICGVLK